MKKFFLSAALIAAFLGYVVYEQMHGSTSTQLPTGEPIAVDTNTNTSEAVPSTSSFAYVDGSYTGQSVDAYYGQVQVEAIITAGAISDVQFLVYPNSAGHTLELNRQIMPQLRSEAIKAQSANVNIISGATQSSEGFRQSLASALALAKK